MKLSLQSTKQVSFIQVRSLPSGRGFGHSSFDTASATDVKADNILINTLDGGKVAPGYVNEHPPEFDANAGTAPSHPYGYEAKPPGIEFASFALVDFSNGKLTQELYL